MSDEDEYVYDSDEDYGSDPQQSDQDDTAIELENTFYEADDCKSDNPQNALELFRKVVELEKEQGNDEVKWRFKALEHIVKLEFNLGLYEKMVTSYEALLELMDSVTRNECTDTINNVLDTTGANGVMGGSATEGAVHLTRMYEVTLKALKKFNNERLWFNTTIKMGRMLLEQKKYEELQGVVADLHHSCSKGKTKDDPNVGTYLLEVYALEIAMFGATGEKKKLKEIFPKTQSLNAAIKDPRIMGSIHETGGKMHMEDGQWSDAYDEFFEGFRNYQEAGNPRARTCLKYVVLANMIALKDINPFDSREAKVYKDDPEIQAMMNLREAFEQSNVKEFERVLHDKRTRIAEDVFVKQYLDNLLRNIRSQVLAKIVKPYKRVRLTFLSEEINVDEKEVESLLVDLIADGLVQGVISQCDGVLDLSAGQSATNGRKYAAMDDWNTRLDKLTLSVSNRLVHY